MSDNAILSYNGKSIELPVVEGAENEHGLDICKLRKETGLVTLDYGYLNTGSTRSAITYVDGEHGILRYRGYSIEDLNPALPRLQYRRPGRKGNLPRNRLASDLRRTADSAAAGAFPHVVDREFTPPRKPSALL